MQSSRRTFLRLTLAGTAGLMAGGARAAPDGDRRLLLVILRGGMDGLSALPPVGDPHFAEVRGGMDAPGVGAPFDGLFALGEGLASLAPLLGAGELLGVHAVATPLRDRSHFKVQDVLENGTTTPQGAKDGWLNRALGGATAGVAIGRGVPLVLQGARPVASVNPLGVDVSGSDFVARVTDLWADDPLLSAALAEGVAARQLTATAVEGGRREGGLARVAEGIAAVLRRPDAPRVAVVELGGWDTHARQKGALGRRLEGLAAGILAVREALGTTWSRTAVCCVSEFGRTVRPNGTGGTDHGTAGALLLAGGAVNGGRVIADWPGLGERDRFEGRDLRPTLDVRAVFKALLTDHLRLPSSAVASAFPGSDELPVVPDLIRT